jgi:hypothetical protein
MARQRQWAWAHNIGIHGLVMPNLGVHSVGMKNVVVATGGVTNRYFSSAVKVNITLPILIKSAHFLLLHISRWIVLCRLNNDDRIKLEKGPGRHFLKGSLSIDVSFDPC